MVSMVMWQDDAHYVETKLSKIDTVLDVKNFEKCSFKISGTICKKIISLENAKTLLQNGKTNKIIGFTSKQGKPFDAYLKLDENKKIVFEF